jgi:hypothetical protein
VLAAALLAGSTTAAQQIGQIVVKRGTITEDLYLGGGTVDVRADVTGEVVAAGGRVIIEQRVTGDVLAAGGTVDVAADVLDDVRAAGGRSRWAGPSRATPSRPAGPWSSAATPQSADARGSAAGRLRSRAASVRTSRRRPTESGSRGPWRGTSI